MHTEPVHMHKYTRARIQTRHMHRHARTRRLLHTHVQTRTSVQARALTHTDTRTQQIDSHVYAHRHTLTCTLQHLYRFKVVRVFYAKKKLGASYKPNNGIIVDVVMWIMMGVVITIQLICIYVAVAVAVCRCCVPLLFPVCCFLLLLLLLLLTQVVLTCITDTILFWLWFTCSVRGYNAHDSSYAVYVMVAISVFGLLMLVFGVLLQVQLRRDGEKHMSHATRVRILSSPYVHYMLEVICTCACMCVHACACSARIYVCMCVHASM